MALAIKKAVVTILGQERLQTWRYIGPSWQAYHRDWLREGLSEAERKRILGQRLKMVEIEVHSYCNRRCWFCPNASVDRRSAVHYLPVETYQQVLRELAGFGFGGTLSFSRYNEPFADEVFFERLRQAREALPEATLFTNTNGDYVTPEALERAHVAGLDSLAVQYYAAQGDWTPQSAAEALHKTAARLGLEVAAVETSLRNVNMRIADPRLEIKLVSVNWDAWRVSRGGTVSAAHAEVRRRAPCTYFFDKVYIDYNGSVMPCCNVRSDVAAHKGMILGAVGQDQSLADIVFGRKAVAWRRAAARYQDWREPCRTCEAFAMPDSLPWRWIWQARSAMGL
jgi:radical SAM protein with 4Fe4S-binding SPASM domain